MKYNAKSNLLQELSVLPYFTKEQIVQIGTDETTHDLAETTIDTYVSRFLKSREIITLKRGLYTTKAFYEKNKNEPSYLFYVANVLRKPSYISSWTALQYYGLTTDVIHTVDSVTIKVTKNYKTKIGSFKYRSIKDDLFSGFSLVESGKWSFFIANPEKALFDLLYFRTKQLKGFSWEDVTRLIEELRIDVGEMEEDEKKRFSSMIKEYINYE